MRKHSVSMNTQRLPSSVVYLERLDECTINALKRKCVEIPQLQAKRRKKGKQQGYDGPASTINGVIARNGHADEVENIQLNQSQNPAVLEFLQITDAVLDATSEVDLSELMERDGEDEETSLLSTSEMLLNESLLSSVAQVSSHLKSCGLTNQIPCKRLLYVMKAMHLCVTVPPALLDSESSEEERDMAMERIPSSLDASLVILNIMTSVNMPKAVYIEDHVLRIVKSSKMLLQNVLYPQFDPHFRINQDSAPNSTRTRRTKNAAVKDERLLHMYSSLTEIVSLVTDVVEIQELTDAILLEASSLAISPFLVENVYDLQQTSLRLTCKIFSRYEKHQQLILEDILSLFAKLPCSKKNVRTYRISHGEQIQALTTLTLHLIQSVVKCPEEILKDNAVTVLLSMYEKALRIAHVFMSIFLSKCSSKSEDDYRPLFESFVTDLLDIVYHPEWPAVDPVLIIIGNLLVKQFKSSSAEMTGRVAALGYLGLIAARLRKDAVSGTEDRQCIDALLARHGLQNTGIEEQIIHLQLLLLNYLLTQCNGNGSKNFCRQFYIAQWCHDCSKYLPSLHPIKKPNGLSKEACAKAQQRLFLTLSTKQCLELNETLSTSTALSVSRYLATQHSLDECHVSLASQNSVVQGHDSKVHPSCADFCLMQILFILGETTTALRSKAMKCLAQVIEADPHVLFQEEVQEAIHGRCLDQSTSVREATVSLIGQSILQDEKLIDNYYDMLSARILDTGISVRKRVITIFRDICREHPSYSKVPDMCAHMLRRIGDEEGIKKLVTETFEGMWFLPREQNDTVDIGSLAENIISVVAACQSPSFFDWLEQLIHNLLKKEKGGQKTLMFGTCHTIVAGLVQAIPDLVEQFKDGSAADGGRRVVACFSSIHVFCKVRAEFLTSHCTNLYIYLDHEFLPQLDSVVRHHVIHILEMTLPLLVQPDKELTSRIEDLLKKLLLTQGTLIIQRGFSCLAEIVRNVTNNFEMVHFFFQKFFRVLLHLKMEHEKSPSSPVLETNQPLLLRSLFIIGLVCQHFDCNDFGEDVVGLQERIFQVLFYFTAFEAEEVRHKALCAIGHMSCRHSDLMLERSLQQLYVQILSEDGSLVRLRCQVLKNIQMFLAEEETRMMRADQRWKELHEQLSIKEMADVQSGMASTIIQVYLKHLLELFFCSNTSVRLAALNAVTTVLHQGLVHPAQCVPYLICLGSDSDVPISQTTNHWLREIDKKYPGFVQTKAVQGIRMSYQLQLKLQVSSTAVRGLNLTANSGCLNGCVYTLLRTNRGHRRVFINALLKLFNDSQDTDLKELVYVTDCLSGFGFQQVDEVLFLIHQLDVIVAISGSNVLQSFTKILYPDRKKQEKQEDEEEEDDEDVDSLLSCLPQDLSALRTLYVTSQRYHLLLLLKKHLKSVYGITDKTIQEYSPTGVAKLNDKPLNIKSNARFNPTVTLNILTQKKISSRELVKSYLTFKDLMLAIDMAMDKDDNSSSRAAQQLPLIACTSNGEQ